jgi:DNA-binding response OmpR family regulator
MLQNFFSNQKPSGRASKRTIAKPTTPTKAVKSIKSAKAMGADDYITKPLILEYLESTVLTKVKNLKKAAA